MSEKSFVTTCHSLEIPLQEKPNRCVLVMDKSLTGGHLANAVAVIALTAGQRHPILVGAPLVDASGVAHPGLIPTGIPMLCASREELRELREKALAEGCDVVDFPVQGQRTKSYVEFMEAMTRIETEDIEYTGIALIGQKSTINRLTKKLGLL